MEDTQGVLWYFFLKWPVITFCMGNQMLMSEIRG